MSANFCMGSARSRQLLPKKLFRNCFECVLPSMKWILTTSRSLWCISIWIFSSLWISIWLTYLLTTLPKT